MAGFSIVMVMFAVIIIIGIIYAVFQLCAILGICFSIAALVQSDRFIKSGAKNNFRLAKGFNTAAAVFFAISCIVGGLTLLMFICVAIDIVKNPNQSLDVISMLSAAAISCGTQIACVVLKLISAKKYNEAKACWNRLFNAGTYSGSVNCYSSFSSGFYTTASTVNVNAAQTEKVRCPYCGAENHAANRFCVQCGETLIQ